jgi:hypothetical protein
MHTHQERKRITLFVNSKYCLIICIASGLIGSCFRFPCVISSGHEVKLRKHGHGVIMSYSLGVTGLGGYGYRFSKRVRGATRGA